MKGDKKLVLINALLYSAGNILLKVFSFLLIPLYTSYLDPEQYGTLNIAISFINVASCVVMGGLQFSAVRFYTDFKENKKVVANMLGTIFCFITVIGLILAFVLIISQKLWVGILFSDIKFYPVVLLAIFISLVSGIYNVYQEALKGMQQAKKSIILSYIFFFLLLGTNILTVVVWRMGATGVLLSTLFVNFTMVIVMCVGLHREGLIKITIDIPLLKQLLKFSLPLLPHTLSYSISSFVTRVIINSKLSTSILGLFSLATQFGYVSDIVCNSVQSAFQPWVFSKLKDIESGRVSWLTDVRSMTHMLLWVNGLIYLLIGAFAQEAIELMANSEYYSAWKYVPAIVLVIAFKSPLYFYMNLLYFDKSKTKYLFITTIIGCALVIFFNIIFVPILGIYGSIVADFIGLFVRSILVIIIAYSYRYTSQIYSLGKILFYTFIPMLALLISVFPSYLNLFSHNMECIYKISCLTIYLGLIFFIYHKPIINLIKTRINY